MLKMKKLSKISLLICLCLAPFSSFADAGRQVAGTVTFMIGDVFASSIFLSAGKIWLNARKIVSKSDSFQVRTDKAICAIRGTQFRVDTGSNHTRISVYSGEVATWSALFDRAEYKDAAISKPYPVAGPHPVSMEKWVEIVKAFQQITIDAKGGYEKQDLDIESLSEDAWTIWNMTRDSSTSIHP